MKAHALGTIIGYSPEDIEERTLALLGESKDNPAVWNENISYLNRNHRTCFEWIRDGKANVTGETSILALGLLEKRGRIPRLPDPTCDDARLSLVVAIARRMVKVDDLKLEFGQNNTNTIHQWARGSEFSNSSKFRLLWALSKSGVLDWSWLQALPDPVQRVIAFLVTNPRVPIKALIDSLPKDLAGQGALSGILDAPNRFVNSELATALKKLVPLPELVKGAISRPPSLTTPVGTSTPSRRPTETDSESTTIADMIARMDIRSRIIGTAELLLTDLRLLMMAGKNQSDRDKLLAVLADLRSLDKGQRLFKLENILAVVNTGESRIVQRWMKEELK